MIIYNFTCTLMQNQGFYSSEQTKIRPFWDLFNANFKEKYTYSGTHNIIWTNAALLVIGTLGTNFNESINKMQIFTFKKIHFKMSSAKCKLAVILTRPQCIKTYSMLTSFDINFRAMKSLCTKNVWLTCEAYFAKCQKAWHDIKFSNLLAHT